MGGSKDKSVLYGTSKCDKVQLCMDCSHFCKQQHLECINIPETLNISMWLYRFTISFQSVLHKPTIYLINATQMKKEIRQSSG